MSKKNKKHKKGLPMWVWILLIMLIVVVGIYYYAKTKTIQIEKETILKVKNGYVDVYHNNIKTKITNSTIVHPNDVVETHGEAVLFIEKNKVVYLKPNTKVKLEQSKGLKGIYLFNGEVLAKIVKLTGKKDFYVSNDNFVAMVEGTMFKFTIEKIVLLEGQLKVQSKKTKKELTLKENHTFEFKNQNTREINEEERKELKELKSKMDESTKEQISSELCKVYNDFKKYVEKFNKNLEFKCSTISDNIDYIIPILKEINTEEDVMKLIRPFLKEIPVDEKIVRFLITQLMKNPHLQKAITLAKAIDIANTNNTLSINTASNTIKIRSK